MGPSIAVPSNDPVRSAILLDELLRDRQRLENAAKAASELGEKRFDFDILAAQILSILEKTVEKTNSAKNILKLPK